MSTRPFGDWLAEQRDGRTADELTEALAQLVQSVIDTGKAGTLTLRIKVGKIGRGTNMVQVTDEVIAKPPKAERDSAIFFSDEDGRLSRNDPYQPSLLVQEPPARTVHLRELPAVDAVPLREVGNG